MPFTAYRKHVFRGLSMMGLALGIAAICLADPSMEMYWFLLIFASCGVAFNVWLLTTTKYTESMNSSIATECPNVWVAEDPTQPGTAFAVCDAAPRFAKDAEEEIDHWKITYGVDARLMNKDDARQWLINWDREKSALQPFVR